MRLQHYITEAGEKEVHLEEVEDLYDLLKKDCKKYLGLLKGRKPLFRAVHTTKRYISVGIKDVRTNRQPRIMNRTTLKFMNEYLKKRNLPLRTECVMCTSDENSIRKFGGQHCFIFPIGNFKFAMVRSVDMNYAHRAVGWKPDELDTQVEDYYRFFRDTDEDNKEEIYDNLDKVIDGESQSAFDEAYRYKYEMWFDCKKYYWVDIESKWSIIYNMF